MSAFSRVGGGVLLGDGRLAGGLWGGGGLLRLPAPGGGGRYWGSLLLYCDVREDGNEFTNDVLW